jgi:hypothetical protein
MEDEHRRVIEIDRRFSFLQERRIRMIEVERLSSFPAGSNPFCYDGYNMGTQFGNNVMVMYDVFEDKPVRYLIIVNILTGERIQLSFTQDIAPEDKATGDK